MADKYKVEPGSTLGAWLALCVCGERFRDRLAYDQHRQRLGHSRRYDLPGDAVGTEPKQ